MPTGLAFRGGSLYVIAINKLLRYDNAEANLDKMPDPVVVYDDMPSYVAHGWKYIVTDKDGAMYLPFGPPFNIGIPPTSVSQIRRVDPKTGLAEIVALGVRNSVGGDIDPRTGDYWFTENARDWISDDLPSDKLNHIPGWPSISAIPIATRETCLIRSSRSAINARSSRRRW